MDAPKTMQRERCERKGDAGQDDEEEEEEEEKEEEEGKQKEWLPAKERRNDEGNGQTKTDKTDEAAEGGENNRVI